MRIKGFDVCIVCFSFLRYEFKTSYFQTTSEWLPDEESLGHAFPDYHFDLASMRNDILNMAGRVEFRETDNCAVIVYFVITALV